VRFLVFFTCFVLNICIGFVLSDALHVWKDVTVAISFRQADRCWARRFAVASPRFIGRKSLSPNWVWSRSCDYKFTHSRHFELERSTFVKILQLQHASIKLKLSMCTCTVVLLSICHCHRLCQNGCMDWAETENTQPAKPKFHYADFPMTII